MDIPVKCVECGNWLDEDLNQKGELEVGLCETCIEKTKEEAYQKGYDEGYDQTVSDAEE